MLSITKFKVWKTFQMSSTKASRCSRLTRSHSLIRRFWNSVYHDQRTPFKNEDSSCNNTSKVLRNVVARETESICKRLVVKWKCKLQIVQAFNMPSLTSKRPKYYTPNEVNIHNTLKDLWVSFLGKVYDLTPMCERHAGTQCNSLQFDFILVDSF